MNIKNEWLKMYNEGLSLNKISLKSGCCSQTVSDHLNSLGVETNTRIIDNNIKEQWPQLYLDGLSYEDISKKFKCANMTVYNYIKKSGIKTRSNRESHIGKGKGWRVDDNGYVRCTRKWSNCNRFMHRIIMEKYLGRKLLSSEIIHHINFDKLDNKLENLQITTRAEHNKIHKFFKR